MSRVSKNIMVWNQGIILINTKSNPNDQCQMTNQIPNPNDQILVKNAEMRGDDQNSIKKKLR